MRECFYKTLDTRMIYSPNNVIILSRFKFISLSIYLLNKAIIHPLIYFSIPDLSTERWTSPSWTRESTTLRTRSTGRSWRSRRWLTSSARLSTTCWHITNQPIRHRWNNIFVCASWSTPAFTFLNRSNI